MKYAAESEPYENDQLYHIQWEDGDTQDYDEAEFNEGKRVYSILMDSIENPEHLSPKKKSRAK